MAALTTDRLFNAEKSVHNAERYAGPCVADDIVYQGAFLGEVSGVLRPLQAGDPFGGIAVRKVDNTGGAAGDKQVEAVSGHLVEVTISGADEDNVGAMLYASNDNDVTLTKGSNSLIGLLHSHITGTRFYARIFTPGFAQAFAALEARVTLNDAKVSA